MKLSIVILNWNGKLLLKKFLPNIILYTPNTPIYVVDNGSEDDFEPGKVHLTSRDARWVYLADDTADKDDAPEDIDDKGESEDALGTIESDTDFHIKPGDDLQSHIMKEIFITINFLPSLLNKCR